MKKLYRKSSVHPSPSPSPSEQISSLSFLPATILTLATALCSDDREVLSYLLSCSTSPFIFPKNSLHFNTNNVNHPPCFTCYCFTCYTSYWARWDSSPNRQLIHEIIDAFEDQLLKQRYVKQSKITRKAKRKSNININIRKKNDNINDADPNGLTRVDTNTGLVKIDEECGGNVSDETEEKQSGSVRKIVSFIGERIWGSVWG